MPERVTHLCSWRWATGTQRGSRGWWKQCLRSRPWSWRLSLPLQRTCRSRESVAYNVSLPAIVATRNWAAAAAESVTWVPPAITSTLTLAPGPTATIPTNPTTPRSRGTHHPGAPGGNTSKIKNTSNNKPPATPEACAATMRAPATRTAEAELVEGANCRFSNIARGRAGKETQNLCYSTTYWKTKGIPLVIKKLYC